jgi:hypothetical protein
MKLQIRSFASQSKLNLSNATIWLAGVAARARGGPFHRAQILEKSERDP